MSVNSKMTAIADAIRLKTGGTETLTLDEMASSLNNIPTQASKTITPGASSQVAIASKTYATGSVIVKGDANLKAENIIDGVSIFGVSGTYVGGNTSDEDALVTRYQVVNYSNSRVHQVGDYAFAGCTRLKTVDFQECKSVCFSAFLGCGSLTSVNFPVCQNIYNDAFSGCRELITISFPMCTNIGSYAFYNCDSLSKVNFPSCETIEASAFKGCTSITTMSFSVCTNINHQAFQGCTRLKQVDFPACTNIGSSAFYNCKSLSKANFPACTNIDQYAFYSCTSLTSVSFPVCANIHNNAFQGCTSLKQVGFPACTNIDKNAFYSCTSLTTASFAACATFASSAFNGCTKLSSIYLTCPSICTLTHSNAFSKTGITSSTGAIYVPLSLGWSYKNATNWTYFSNRIFSIEGDEIVDPDAGGESGGGTGELFDFTIDVVTYQAEDGMTWADWVDSVYNIDSYINTGDAIVDEFETRKVVSEDLLSPVDPLDVIDSRCIYSTDAYIPEV